MEDTTRYFGVTFANLRKALYLMYFGVDAVKDKDGNVIKAGCQDFDSPKYKYIIPLQGNFENPIAMDSKDTYIMYWIERDASLTQDDYVEENDTGYSRNKCVANILVRFIGKEAEQWVRAFRHLAKRNGVTDIWSGVCNAEKLEYTSPIIPRKVSYSGLNSQVAFDIRFKLYYDEVVSTGWKPLEGIDFTIKGEIAVED